MTNPYVSTLAKPKENWIAYVLWGIFLLFGGHRFYLKRTKTAIAQLILTCTLYGILVSLPWAIVDAFLIPKMVREENAKLAFQWEAERQAEAAARGERIMPE